MTSLAFCAVKLPRKFLSVHIPLQDVDVEMGPTRFCPCTHGDADPSEDRVDIINRINTQHGLNICDRDEALHYDAATKFGTVTVYDGAVRHKGLENGSTRDRPVLVLEFAASAQTAALRDYTGHLRSNLPVAFAEANKFMAR